MKTFVATILKAIRSLTLRAGCNLRNKFDRLKPDEATYTQFHSQFGEDRYVYQHLSPPKKGVFVDAGAGHPINLSNTYFFEKNGWTGLCIDADPTQVALLQKHRANVQWAAVSATEGEIEFTQAISPTFSSVTNKEQPQGLLRVPGRETIRVPSYPLEMILKKNGINEIDLLSIDVEGLEVDACKSLDWELHKPRIVVVEFSTFGLPDNDDALKKLFADLPYRLVHTTCTNLIFVRESAGRS